MRFICFLAMFLPAVVFAAEDPAADARDAMAQIEAASAELENAVSARDRVRALTQIIGAFEEGLSALRSGQRTAAVREAELAAGLQARDEEITALLSVLQQMASEPSPVIFLHPQGPTGSARAGMLLADTAPALSAQAEGLRRDLEELQMLRDMQRDATASLQAGLTEIQAARTALNQAIADRGVLPARFTNDPVREAILIASAETLDSFAGGLERIAVDVIAPAPADLQGQKGALPLPVNGSVLRRAGEPDAAGVTRPGIIVTTQERAIVTSPVAATIRYTGALLNLGQVVIIEPQSDVLFILAGLGTIYGNAGEVIDAGTPLGLMGGAEAQTGEAQSTDGDVTGAGRSETLYIEVRQNNTPEDPGLWFRTDKDG
ncbi:peptidoglycan DD-metalloendopeptidase family protein [Roseobacter sp.]|uniref:murein hydrolase activator EnvC family protein n=1 Tax=Roseobacter sp. TaxID=1907202 RepID=UPI0025E88819|nr:peptidoglycan DD-metalloendopeptidase family protein [Roseobacter sp.]